MTRFLAQALTRQDPANSEQAGLAQGSQRWQLQLVPEDRSDPDNVCHASRALFANLVKEVSGGDAHSNHWVFFVPGYCSPCREGLDKARQLQEVHGVNVILFSWPSDPREAISDPVGAYRRTQEAALLSAVALDRALASLLRIFVEPVRQAGGSHPFSFSLLAHSLGNYVIQKLVQSDPIYHSHRFPFDNIILHQADVDVQGSQTWIKAMKARKRKYVTTNQYDAVLRMISDVANPTRLGQVTHGVGLGEEIIHVDFTDARHVNNQHWFFGDVVDNQIINTFCRNVLHGVIGEFCLFADGEENGRYQAYPLDLFPPLGST